MKLETISKYLGNNKLDQDEIHSLLRKEIEPAIGHQYSKGYLRSIRDNKRRREHRQSRLDLEFKVALDFISDLTHEK